MDSGWLSNSMQKSEARKSSPAFKRNHWDLNYYVSLKSQSFKTKFISSESFQCHFKPQRCLFFKCLCSVVFVVEICWLPIHHKSPGSNTNGFVMSIQKKLCFSSFLSIFMSQPLSHMDHLYSKLLIGAVQNIRAYCGSLIFTGKIKGWEL